MFFGVLEIFLFFILCWEVGGYFGLGKEGNVCGFGNFSLFLLLLSSFYSRVCLYFKVMDILLVLGRDCWVLMKSFSEFLV